MLFPLEQETKLVGIARLARESKLLRAKSEVEYFELPSRGILNRCSNPRMPFTWTINPYRGCEFGCKYCYARYTHEFMGMEDGQLFEQRIYAKQGAARTLRAELRRHPEGSIAIGTSTDPYQPAERRFEVTRSILEVFAAQRGRSVSITTKSDLIVRDIELLDLVRRRNVLHVNMTVTTTDAELARKLEPRAPRPDLRLAAVRQLARKGISVGVFANPVMPMLTDSLENLDALAIAAEAAGARYFGGGTLFLMPSAQAQFIPFLEREFPALAKRYRDRYSRQPYLRGEYAKLIRERVEQVRANHHLAASPQSYQPEEWAPEPQRTLFEPVQIRLGA
jgi:DNA repair photolyase